MLYYYHIENKGDEVLAILVLDDEKEIADLVEVYLLNEGYLVYKCYEAKQALAYIDGNCRNIDLAILDVMVADCDGFTICKKVREKGLSFPIIMLTAKVEDIDKITGLSIGADDYITKPFNPLELIARVKAQLRRYTKYNENSLEQEVLEVAGLVINKLTHTCLLYDKVIDLTPREFSILLYLCENLGRVISSEELFEKVWGEQYLDCNNTIMVHIRRIREKLGESTKHPKFIKTVWGVGYKIEK